MAEKVFFHVNGVTVERLTVSYPAPGPFLRLYDPCQQKTVEVEAKNCYPNEAMARDEAIRRLQAELERLKSGGQVVLENQNRTW